MFSSIVCHSTLFRARGGRIIRDSRQRCLNSVSVTLPPYNLTSEADDGMCSLPETLMIMRGILAGFQALRDGGENVNSSPEFEKIQPSSPHYLTWYMDFDLALVLACGFPGFRYLPRHLF